MDIKFSRHAKRRAKLYGIPESTVTDILASMNLHQGEHEIIKNVIGIEYPLKIIISVEKDTINNKLSAEERKKTMKVHYDNEVDAIYIKLGNQKPDGVVEISEGVNLDTTSENKIVGIEILNASKKMNIKTILSYELELDKKLIQKTA